MKKNIPFSKPDIIEEDLQIVLEVIKSGWLAHGAYSTYLEDLFCEYTGANFATTVSNCTAGLHLSCLAANFKKGDEIILPSQTHVATAHAIEFTGAKPIFVDVDPLTGCILIRKIKEKINSNTKGIIPVHMAGYPCNMKDIKSICDESDLILIEDCAHGIGTVYDGIHAGNFGSSGCFSFYPTKQITTGEGGVVISNNQNFIEKIKRIKAFGIDTPPELRTKPGFYDVKELGYNYRMTDFQAALGLGQMKRYHKNVKRRRKNARLYCDLLESREDILFTSFSKQNSYFLFQIILKSTINRDKVMLELKKYGIGVSIHYATPVPLMSYYKNKYGYQPIDFPNAVNYANHSISLPVHQNLNADDIDYVCKKIINILDKLC